MNSVDKKNVDASINSFRYGFLLMLFLSIVYFILYRCENSIERFSGFASTPTTFSVFLICVFFLSISKFKKIEIGFYSILIIYFIISGDTRTSIIVFFISLLLYIFRNLFYNKKKHFFVFFVLFFVNVMMYPVYLYANQKISIVNLN